MIRGVSRLSQGGGNALLLQCLKKGGVGLSEALWCTGTSNWAESLEEKNPGSATALSSCWFTGEPAFPGGVSRLSQGGGNALLLQCLKKWGVGFLM